MFIAEEQLKAVLAVEEGNQLKCVYTASLYYGLHRKEAIHLKFRDVDFGDGNIHICNSKGYTVESRREHMSAYV